MQSTEFSRRLQSIKPSPTLALAQKANQMKSQGRTVYNLSLGELSEATHPLIVEAAMRSLEEGKTHYSAPGGSAALRDAISKKYAEDQGVQWDPAQIVCGTGAKELLLHIFMSLLNKGDEAIVPAPYWVSYPSQIEICEAQATVVPFTTPEEWLSPEFLDRHINSRSKLIVINYPNNPAGMIPSESRLLELVEYLESKNLWLISDEIYEVLSFDRPHTSLLSLLQKRKSPLLERIIVVSGFSKGFAMTGWRVGYALGSKPAMNLLKNLQSQSSTCLPAFIEDACCVALSHRAEICTEILKLTQQRRDLAEQSLAGLKDIRYLPAQGAFYLFLDVRSHKAFKQFHENDVALASALLEQTGVALVPGSSFGCPGFLRMSYGLKDQELRDGITALKRFFSSDLG